MTRDINGIIARWLGWTTLEPSKAQLELNKLGWHYGTKWVAPNGHLEFYPPCYDEDSVAITLLPELVQRGFETSLIYTTQGANFDISENIGHVVSQGQASTINGAICAAVVQLIESI